MAIFAGNPDARGIGGWLLVFLISLAMMPLDALRWLAHASWDPERFTWAFIAFKIATVSLCWVTVFCFWRIRRWRTVQLGIAALWLLPLLTVASSWVSLWLLGLRTYFSPSAETWLGLLTYPAICTIYLLRSRRVARTYGPSPEDEAEALERTFA